MNKMEIIKNVYIKICEHTNILDEKKKNWDNFNNNEHLFFSVVWYELNKYIGLATELIADLSVYVFSFNQLPLLNDKPIYTYINYIGIAAIICDKSIKLVCRGWH